MNNNEVNDKLDELYSIHVDLRRPITSIERHPFSKYIPLNKEIVDDQEDKSAWSSRKFFSTFPLNLILFSSHKFK